jgi:DNA-binding NarL/FixJ family response regulator
MLAVAPVSTLVYRALNDDPDAIVIFTEDLGSVGWRKAGDLIALISSTSTVLLAHRIDGLLRKRAAALHIRSILPLDMAPDQLLAAIHATAAGLTVALETSVQTENEPTAWNMADEIETAEGVARHLTARETVVLRLMALGLGNKEIAARLDISEHTAKFHVSSILAKLGAVSRTEAVTIGITRGLVAI